MADPVPTTETPATPAAPSPEGVAEAAGTPTPETPKGPDPVEALRAEVQQARAEAESARRFTAALVANLTPTAPAADPAAVDAQFREQLEKDPRAAISQAFEERMRPLVAEQLHLQAQSAYATVDEKFRKSEDPHDRREWQQYGPEVQAFMRDLPPDVRATPDQWTAAFDLIRSRHIGDVVKGRATANVEAERRATLEGASGARGGLPAKNTLTPQEEKMAKTLGLSREEWIRERDALDRDMARRDEEAA